MNVLKVYGMRKTGTRYLTKLLYINISNSIYKVPHGAMGDILGWKHGEPKYSDGTLYFFVFRDLYEWLGSMYTYPLKESYQVKKDSISFIDFVTRPFTIDVNEKGQSLYKVYKNIFECRYEKLQWYFNFYETNNNSVLVHLDYIINDHRCIARVLDLFDIERDDDFKDKEEHVEKSIAENHGQIRKNPNNYILSDKDKEAIQSYINEEIEQRVNNLKCMVHF